jgi:N-acyl-D-aspartate/D-glutamate deacylase
MRNPFRYFNSSPVVIRLTVMLYMDADLTVFDPNTISDRSTVDYPAQTSVGVRYLVVNGQLLIEDGEMDLTLFPGKPVRRDVR